MTLELTRAAIVSDITPETAELISGPEGDFWTLSWLPGRRLTREQAVHGMVLDEILSDPMLLDDAEALELAAVRAAELGLELERAVTLLCLRVVHRLSPAA
ncbi:hypothetical protein NDR87_31845 [Nocardia sp. CDC159]|uniref:Uncharacterized protein n=1 Tax=Nocardia pulmonis TaxID=2951408 RepID=A0A9X2ECR6_9NOCA|nr:MULTISPECIES: hypothetical protein [Nocardia]MCM6778084.1 hypothetical protein [Nocardia pulmonis]MCM6790973.1 hypothetical protein [Nocardia sp. CDC159]